MFQRESLDILKLSQAIKKCDAILIGAGAGLSSAAGLSYSGNRFKKYFWKKIFKRRNRNNQSRCKWNFKNYHVL